MTNKSFTDTGMQTVALAYALDDLIPIVQLDNFNEVEDTGNAPIGAGYGTRGTRQGFSGTYDDVRLINLLITKSCNFRCDYCVEDKDLPNLNPWTLERFDQLVQWIKAQNVKHDKRVTISFFGGEPLLEWDQLKIFMKYGIEKYGDIIDFNISTNIVLLDREKLEWIDKNVTSDNISFLLSLDGFERVYSRHVTKDKKNNLMHIIRKHLGIMKEEYNHILKRSSFRVSAMPEYLDILAEDLYEMVDYGPENIIIHPVTTEAHLKWDLDKYKKLEDMINDICIYAINTSDVVIECMEGVSKKNHNCGAGHTMLAVNATGEIFSCYFTAHAEMKDDMIGNFITNTANEKLANIYKLNPNHDPKCGECDKKYCFQCSVKNLLHSGQHFCSSLWCKELADLYENTLSMCDLTGVNRVVSKGSHTGVTMQNVFEEILCSVEDIGHLANALLIDKPYKPDSEHVCGCESAVGDKVDALLAIRDLSTIKLSLEQVHNQRFPNNKVSSL